MELAAPPSSSPLHRWREIQRWEGAGALLGRLLAQVGWRRVGWWVRGLGDLPPAPPLPAGWRLVVLGSEDVAGYLALRRGATAAQLAERFAAGHRALALADRAGRLAAVAWSAREHALLAYLSLPLRLAPGEVYLFDTFTAAVHRGRGLQPLLTAHELQAARAGGATAASAAIEPQNRPSVRSFERLGFRRVGTLTRIGFGRLARVVRRGEVPR